MRNYLCEIMGTEQKLQTKIINYLKSDGWLVVKTIQLSINGMPDIFAFKNGRTIFIEVKSPNGKRSELQKYRIEQLTLQGFTAFFCDNFENMLHNIKNDSNNHK